jgi:hypothetical protein
VAVPTDGTGADVDLAINRTAWAALVNGRHTIGEVLDDASASDPVAAAEFLSWFDLD